MRITFMPSFCDLPKAVPRMPFVLALFNLGGATGEDAWTCTVGLDGGGEERSVVVVLPGDRGIIWVGCVTY